MLNSNFIVYVTAELAVLLLAISVFLIIHVSKLKKLIARLEEKIVALRKAIGIARKETKEALRKLAEKEKFKPKFYLDYLDDEIEETKAHHQSLQPDRDIVLDITPDTPIERQADSLRHAFLIAEKEARYAGDGESSSWEVLQGKFQQIIQFYSSIEPARPVEPSPEPSTDAEGDNEELENYKKRVENLEGFKRLFFDMEEKWEVAKQQAEDYHQQLLALGKDMGAGEDFENLMEQYSKAFNEIDDVIAAGVGGQGASRSKTDSSEAGRDAGNQPSVGKMIIANQEEITRLKNMAVDQHKVITQLKKKLYEAQSIEDKEQVIESLTKQMEKQERFLTEAETCTKLLEDELSRLMRENEQLQRQVKKAVNNNGADAEEHEQMQNMISDLTHESKEMLSTIAELEQENRHLKEQLASGGGGEESSEKVKVLQEKLSEMQQELLNLQAQHIELEERYLELKMK